MDGIGELYGSSFDDVLRHPRPALFVLALDSVAFVVAAIVLAAAGVVPSPNLGALTLESLAFAVPHPMSSVANAYHASTPVELLGGGVGLALAAFLLALAPVAAYVTGGFLHVLRDVYLTERDPGEYPPRDQYDVLWGTFQEGARNHFVPLLMLRLIRSGIVFATLMLALAFPVFRNHALGVLTVDFLLLFAPYAVVVDGLNAFAAIRRSVTTISDYLASSLVTLLFGLLTTGGAGVLIAPLVRWLGVGGFALGVLLYAPVGAALSLFMFKVYLGFRGIEWEPAKIEAPAERRMPAEGI